MSFYTIELGDGVFVRPSKLPDSRYARSMCRLISAQAEIKLVESISTTFKPTFERDYNHGRHP